jgi:hypothetical protein
MLIGFPETGGLLSGCGMLAFDIRASAHQHDGLFMLPAGEIRIAEDLFESARFQAPRPFSCGLGRHQHEMRFGLARPHIEVLPFQKRIDRAAQVKGKGVRFHSKE